MKQKAAASFKSRGNVLRGRRLNYNAGTQQRYVVALKKLLKQMVKETKKQVIKLFEGGTSEEFFEKQKMAAAMDASLSSQARILMNFLTSKFDRLFKLKAKSLSEEMLKSTFKVSETSLRASLKELSVGFALKTGVVTPGTEDIATAIIAENVSLIKSIPQQYLKNVTGAVMRSITTGNGLLTLIPEIQKYSGQSNRRVKNLALDQTRKAYNSINKQRMQAVGVKQFEWRHSGGGQKPRDSHLKIAGHIFNFENLEKQQEALGVPKKDQGIPGYPINCRCTMLPVIEF